MADGNWDAILKQYSASLEEYRLAFPDRAKVLAEHFDRMRLVIPEIRRILASENVIPGTSHQTFYLRVSDRRSKICVWCEQVEEQYIVTIYDPSAGEFGADCEEITVNADKLPSTLQTYVHKLQNYN